MASEMVSASTTKKRGVKQPPSSKSEVWPNQPSGFSTGMSVRSWSLNLQDAVTFIGLLHWGGCSSHPPRWCQPGSWSHLAVVFPDADRPSFVGPRLNVLVVVDHDYDAAVVVVQFTGGDVAEDGPGAPEPVPGRHPGIHPNPVTGQPQSVGVGIRVRLPGVGLDDLIRQVGELAELGVERRYVDIAAELVLGDVDIVAVVVFETDAVTTTAHEDVEQGIHPLVLGDLHEGEHRTDAP